MRFRWEIGLTRRPKSLLSDRTETMRLGPCLFPRCALRSRNRVRTPELRAEILRLPRIVCLTGQCDQRVSLTAGSNDVVADIGGRGWWFPAAPRRIGSPSRRAWVSHHRTPSHGDRCPDRTAAKAGKPRAVFSRKTAATIRAPKKKSLKYLRNWSGRRESNARP